MGQVLHESPGRDAAGRGEALQFPDTPRLELDQLLEQLRDRAEDVLATQGRLRGLLRANAAVAADLSLPVLLRHIVDAARDLLRARYAAVGVNGRGGQLQQFVQAGRLLDADDSVVGEVATFLRDLLAAGKTASTLRSYGMDLLR